MKRNGVCEDEEMAALTIIQDENGDAVVEAAIIFPIMIMIFAALVLLAIYLPTRAALQHATQLAATAVASEQSDTWLRFDEDSMTYYWDFSQGGFPGIYTAMFSGIGDAARRGEDFAINVENRGVSAKSGVLSVHCYDVNHIIYKEIVVTATREFEMPINMSFIGFPTTLPITVTSTAVVQNSEDFVRNIDLAADLVGYISEKFGLTDVSEAIASSWQRVRTFFKW